MIRHKKSISPLIATVLLIGFAVAIAVLVWFWYGNIIKEQAQKTSLTGQGKLDCSSQIKLRVKEASCTSDDNVIIFLENKGSSIDDFRIRIDGDVNSRTISLGTGLGETESKQTSISYNSTLGTLGTNITKVVITPVLLKNNNPVVCSEQKIEITPKGNCNVG